MYSWLQDNAVVLNVANGVIYSGKPHWGTLSAIFSNTLPKAKIRIYSIGNLKIMVHRGGSRILKREVADTNRPANYTFIKFKLS